MENPFAPLRIGVYYYGNLLLHVSNYYKHYHSIRSHLDVASLQEYIRHRVAFLEEVPTEVCRITESHFFRGRLSATAAAQRSDQLYNDRAMDDALMATGIETHFLPLRKAAGRKEERGIEVLLSLNVIERCLQGRFDTVVLMVSDSAYIPLLRKIKSLGVQTILLAWDLEGRDQYGDKIVTRTAYDLTKIADYTFQMDREIEEGLRDQHLLVQNLFC